MLRRCIFYACSVALLIAAADAFVRTEKNCTPAPYWEADGRDIMKESYGEVTVVALMELQCEFCIKQINSLIDLASTIRHDGYNMTRFVVVAAWYEPGNYVEYWRRRLQRHNITVVQESRTQQVWSLLGGKKHDILLYDKCSRLAFFVPYPQSFLYYHYVVSVVHHTHHGWCGECPEVGVTRFMPYRPPVITTPTPTPTPRIAYAMSTIIAILKRDYGSASDEADFEFIPLFSTTTQVTPAGVEDSQTSRTRLPPEDRRNRKNGKIGPNRQRGRNGQNRRRKTTTPQTQIIRTEETPRNTEKSTTEEKTVEYIYEYDYDYGGLKRVKVTDQVTEQEYEYTYETGVGNADKIKSKKQKTDSTGKTPQRDENIYEEYYEDYHDERTGRPLWSNAASSTKIPEFVIETTNPEILESTSSEGVIDVPVEKFDIINVTRVNEVEREKSTETTDPTDSTESVTEVETDATSAEVITIAFPSTAETTTPYIMPYTIPGTDCSIFSDDFCYQQQQSGKPWHPCCYKGVYLTNLCLPGKCSTETYHVCCFQKFQQARFRCCHNDKLSCSSPDEFSRCCFNYFTDEPPEIADECCPKNVAFEHWSEKSRVYEYCVPNVQLNYGDLVLRAKMRDHSSVRLELEKISALKFQCPYAFRLPECEPYYYQPDSLEEAEEQEPTEQEPE